MPRPHKCRFIAGSPDATIFKPCGVPRRALVTVELQLDELEALRLADLEGLYQDAAAERMGVSRPTFSRVIAVAHHKVADALLNSKMLIFKGGHVEMTQMRTFCCSDCQHEFQVPFGAGRPGECPVCHSHNFHRLGRGQQWDCRRGAGGHRRRHGCGGGQRQSATPTQTKEDDK